MDFHYERLVGLGILLSGIAFTLFPNVGRCTAYIGHPSTHHYSNFAEAPHRTQIAVSSHNSKDKTTAADYKLGSRAIFFGIVEG